MGGITAAERRAYSDATDRADGKCEGCGEYRPLERHHRRFRGRGGKTTVENLILLCGRGNTGGCHGDAHGANPPEGWAISQYDKRPDHEVFARTHEGLVAFTRDGRRVLVGDPENTQF